METFRWIQPENEENYGTRISVTVDRENSIETVRLGFKHQMEKLSSFLTGCPHISCGIF